MRVRKRNFPERSTWVFPPMGGSLPGNACGRSGQRLVTELGRQGVAQPEASVVEADDLQGFWPCFRQAKRIPPIG